MCFFRRTVTGGPVQYPPPKIMLKAELLSSQSAQFTHHCKGNHIHFRIVIYFEKILFCFRVDSV